MGPFTVGELQAQAQSYRTWINGVFYQDMLRRLFPIQRAALGNVQLETPLEMLNAPDPGFVLNIVSDPTTPKIVVPVRTLRWIDEYCGLIVYLEQGGYKHRTVLPLIYDAMLMLSAGDVEPPGPFAAFGINSKIYKNAELKSDSNKLLNGIFAFLLAHELGHIAHKHMGGLTGIQSQMQEQEADKYAIDFMAQLQISPIALVFLFSASAMMEGAQNTHPLSGARVVAAAENIRSRPRSFIDRKQPDPESWVPRVLNEARQILDVIPLIDDSERRREILNQAKATRFDQLAGLLN